MTFPDIGDEITFKPGHETYLVDGRVRQLIIKPDERPRFLAYNEHGFTVWGFVANIEQINGVPT